MRQGHAQGLGLAFDVGLTLLLQKITYLPPPYNAFILDPELGGSERHPAQARTRRPAHISAG